VFGILTRLTVWVAILSGTSLAFPNSAGFMTATTTVLSTLWEVQSASVGLVFALVVFVFGLLPQGRGRLTYRQFLHRTWAIPLVIFNVGSLFFDGMVLLGFGHQIPQSGELAGYGWAVTVACLVTLGSIASIVVLLGRTVRAMDPTINAIIQRDYRINAIAMVLRAELLEQTALRILSNCDQRNICEFHTTHLGRGIRVLSGSRRDRVVHDVSITGLRLLMLYASHRNLMRPVMLVWPGKTITVEMPVIAIDKSSGRIARWFARRCVRVRRCPPDVLSPALEALHATTLDDIRADHPVEAVQGIKMLAGLHEPIWQAYTAHDLQYDRNARQAFWIYKQTIGDQITQLMDVELSAAAKSRDDTIRRQAASQPLHLAAEALAARASGTIERSLKMLLDTYEATISDLTDDGRQNIPSTGYARGRIAAPFTALLSFTNGHLQHVIDRLGGTDNQGRPLSADPTALESAEFAVAEIYPAHKQMQKMIERALRLRDSLTVRDVLAVWQAPAALLARDALSDQSTDHNHIENERKQDGQLSRQGRLLLSLDEATEDLDAIILQLLLDAQQVETAGRSVSEKTGAHAGNNHNDGGIDPSVGAILDRLRPRGLWRALEIALSRMANEPHLPSFDGSILPLGVVVSGFSDYRSPVMKAFALAAIVRPELIADSAPSADLALTEGTTLQLVVAQTVRDCKQWLKLYGVETDVAFRRAANIKECIEKSAKSAYHDRQEIIRNSPVQQTAIDQVSDASLLAFLASDLLTRLLVWAERPPSTTSDGHPTDRPISMVKASRANFIGDDPSNVSGFGKLLGDELSLSFQRSYLSSVLRHDQSRAIEQTDLAFAVRDAIRDLDGKEFYLQGLAEPRIVVIIPATPYDLKSHMELQQAEVGDWRQKVSEELNLSKELLWNLVGMIEGRLVLRLNMKFDSVIVIDVARFAQVTLRGHGDELSDCVKFEVLEPPSDGCTQSGDLRVGNDDNLTSQPALDALDLLFRLSFSCEITVTDHTAAHVVKFTQ
jgi:hypothetical protein